MSTDYNLTFRKATEMGKHRLAAGRIRLRYLKQQVDEMLPSKHPVVLHWINQIMREVTYIHANMHVITPARTNPETVTEADMEVARNHPVTQVINFQNGQAIAWCHEDRRPSLIYMTGIKRAYCPVCDRYFNAVDVLMSRDGMDFLSAVKQLRR